MSGIEKEVDLKNLPDNVSACQELIQKLIDEIVRLQALTEKQKHQLEQLLRRKYGQKSDRFNPNQLMLELYDALDEIRAESEEEVEEETVVVRKRKQKGHGRNPLPAHLERRRVEHDVSEEEKRCSHCGCEKTCIGEDLSEQLEYEPASLYVIQHVRKKYACKCCGDGVVSAEKPMQPIEKGLPGPGLLAQIVTSKYADHLPLNRLSYILQRNGVEITRQTMCGWMKQCGELLLPVYELMKTRVLQSKVIHTDDTPVKVLDPELDRTRQGRIWVYAGDESNKYIIYDYTKSRSRDGPADFLSGYKGYLQADAYAGYNHLYADGDIKEVACWAHTRRKYVDAQTTDPFRSLMSATFIHNLYKVEEKAKDLSSTNRYALRQEEALPQLQMFHKWLIEENPKVLPKSPIGDAIGYTLGNWEALSRYLEDGDLAIDNNRAERALRGIAVGRNNWIFYGSDNGGNTAAVLTSLVATCKDHHIDPFAYLRDVFTRISAHPINQLEELLPDIWKASIKK
jgi:transposase